MTTLVVLQKFAAKWPPSLLNMNKQVSRSFSSSSRRSSPNFSRLRRTTYLGLGLGIAYYADERFNASSLSRTLRTFGTGAVIALDYKINFQVHPPFAESIIALHERNAERVYALLRANGGLYLKIGQAIAMQSAILPLEFQKRFARFYDDAPQNEWEDVVRVIREEFDGRSPEQVFGAIENTARASASIAQVHYAVLPNGQKVAVKVQKREIAQQVDWDLWAFGAIMYLYTKFFDIPLYPMVPYISQRLLLETNFTNEADNAERTAVNIESEPRLRGRVHIPVVYRNLTTKRIMTAEWIDGIRLSDKEALTASWKGVKGGGGLGVRLADVMKTLVDLISAQIFVWGDVHCDPHPGNVLIRRSPSGAPQLVLLDHGLYVRLEPALRRQYASFWRALLALDNKELQRISSAWGVRNTDAFASATLMRPYGDTAQLLNDAGVPVGEHEDESASERAFVMQQRMRASISDILGDERAWPRALIFLGRTIRMLQANNQMLGSPVNRVGIMGAWAARALADDPGIPRAERWLNWWRHILFRLALLASDGAWYVSRVRQVLGFGGGMERDVEEAVRAIAKRNFGVELNHDPFDG
ncbi:hypothetical protein EW145_g7027 [Phellinidium pouzarii]|uniref:ABC1 atypical kinase-like domain-containing protein n=1 Tax=Phellinidium pouzarii TaxID=167371 RepID=A0A4S4KQB5_9AGAM|nr:hypothetical protein EW145_g7027 [Phellinidium pouzarii]